MSEHAHNERIDGGRCECGHGEIYHATIYPGKNGDTSCDVNDCDCTMFAPARPVSGDGERHQANPRTEPIICSCGDVFAKPWEWVEHSQRELRAALDARDAELEAAKREVWRLQGLGPEVAADAEERGFAAGCEYMRKTDLDAVRRDAIEECISCLCAWCAERRAPGGSFPFHLNCPAAPLHIAFRALLHPGGPDA